MSGGSVRGMLKIRLEPGQILELNHDREFIVIAHHLLVSRQRVLHALPYSKASDRWDPARRGRQSIEKRAAIRLG